MSPAIVKPSAAALRALARRDPVLGRVAKASVAFPGFPQPRQHQSHFHALAKAIVFQQLAGRAAQTIHDRVAGLTSSGRFPNADQVLALDPGRLRGAGLSRNKMLSLVDLAEHVSDGRLRLRSLAYQSDEAVIEALVQVRGIGVWSAQIFLLFRLGRLDVLPSTDLGLQEGLRRLDGLSERPSPKALESRAEVWAPLRSVAAWLLWRVADGKVDAPG